MASSDEHGSPPVSSMVDLLLDTHTLDDFLGRLATAAVRHAPKADGCGITLRRSGTPVTVVSVGPTAAGLDERQYELDDGPCLRSLRTGEETHVADMTEERRWGPYPAHAVSVGTMSSLSFPIAPRTDTAGALNLYAPEPRLGDSSDEVALRALAAQATGAIALAQQLSQDRQFATDLQEAVRYRSFIDQAIGIVMAQQRCTGERALAILRRASQNRNLRLRDLAADVITRVSGAPPPEPPDLVRRG
ncbi:GAF and ANTAR domain-containing protein [Streptomyces sp. NPDC060194]|uniref:GAF and ANTAR domain-containing protein n=1 Tax=Streptomyces sp. NPDC060194 TaxID=3347069 RepID=UPI00365C8C53